MLIGHYYERNEYHRHRMIEFRYLQSVLNKVLKNSGQVPDEYRKHLVKEGAYYILPSEFMHNLDAFRKEEYNTRITDFFGFEFKIASDGIVQHIQMYKP